MTSKSKTEKPAASGVDCRYDGDGYLEIVELKLVVGEGEAFKAPRELAQRLAADYRVTISEGVTADA